MESRNQSIKHWAEDDRPREKMLLKGRNALSDAELLAILIGTGSGNRSAVDLGRELLNLSGGDLAGFGRLRLNQLCQVKGIGQSKAVTILAALELGRRRKENERSKVVRITSGHAAYDLFKPYFEDLEHEEFYCMYLNRHNVLLQIKQLSIGGLAGTYVDAQQVFKFGLDLSASGIILAHNHPSGNLQPSDSDKLLTKKIKQFADFIEMPVMDHLIITDNGYFSFANEGIL